MKHITYFIFIATALATGCVKEWDIPVFSSDSRAIRIVPEITGAFTKSSPLGTADEQTSFIYGDMIGLYCEDGSMVYEYSEEGWNPTDNYYLRWGTDPVTYHAYYPASESSSSSTFTLPTIQRSLDAIKSADYMTCTVTDATYDGTGELYLPLTRMMSKIVVELDGVASGSRIQGIRIMSGEGYSGSEVSDTKIGISPYYETPEGGVSGQNGTVYTAIVTPTESSSTETFITFTYSSNNMTVYGMPRLEAGREYQFTMNLENSTIAFSDPSDGDWNAMIIREEDEIFSP